MKSGDPMVSMQAMFLTPSQVRIEIQRRWDTSIPGSAAGWAVITTGSAVITTSVGDTGLFHGQGGAIYRIVWPCHPRQPMALLYSYGENLVGTADLSEYFPPPGRMPGPAPLATAERRS